MTDIHSPRKVPGRRVPHPRLHGGIGTLWPSEPAMNSTCVPAMPATFE
jgi:hypothetical protein